MDLTPTQWIALALALLLLVQGARGGYRRGPVRQLAGLLALLAAGAVGWLAGAPLGLWLLADSPVPWLLRESAGMVATGALVWLVALAWLWHLGRRSNGSEEAESPVMGAIVGCWTGILNVAVLILSICAWAGFNEAVLTPFAAERSWAAQTRQALAGLPGCAALGSYSPWPDAWVRVASKTRRTLGQPEASRRLMEQEPVRALASHPTFYTAWGDPDIKRLLREGSFWEAACHPKARPLLNDEAFQRQLLEIDLESLLDKSLRK